jgi:hypothetical protein
MTFSRASAWAGLVLVATWTAWEIRHPAVATSFEGLAHSSVAFERLPSAVGSLLALLALAELVARIHEGPSPDPAVSSRAALFAVGVYATMPLAFVPARLRSGGELVVGVLTLALAALGIAWLDASASRRARAVFGVAGAALSVAAALLVWKAPPWSVPVTAASSVARTFDATVPALAYGLGPWVLFAPVALVSRRRSPGAAALSAVAVVALAALAFAPVRAVLPVTLVAPWLAGVVGVELASWQRTSTNFAAVVVSLGFLVAHDLGTAPERLLTPLVTLDATAIAAIATASAHAAKLAQVLLGVTTALVAALAWAPARGWPLPRLSPRTVIFAAPLLAGLGLRIAVYPALLARASPSLALETWADRHRYGEPLAALGKEKDVATAAAAGAWLAAADDAGSRRWLTMGNQPTALAEANASYRAIRHDNVPLLVAGDETTLLAASELYPGETNDNPLERVVLARPPALLHAVDAEIENAVALLGWQLTDDDGKEISHVRAHGGDARKAHLRVVLRVDAPPPTGSCTFVHVDRTPSRFAAEHRELAYPLRWWTAGEIIVDEYAVTLGADFTAGSYPVYWGMGVLPCEDDHRREVTRGPSDGHGRIALGNLELR